MKKYTFRQARSNDLKFVFDLIKSTMKDHITKIYGKWDDEFQLSYCKNGFDANKHKIIIVDKQDIGCIAVSKDDLNIQIERLLILPSFQGLGIGTDIIKKLKQEARKNSKTLSLKVLHSNTKAQTLYERMGFTVTQKTDNSFIMTCKY